MTQAKLNTSIFGRVEEFIQATVENEVAMQASADCTEPMFWLMLNQL